MDLPKMLLILPYTCLGTLQDQIITHDQAEKRALSLYREGEFCSTFLSFVFYIFLRWEKGRVGPVA